MKRIYTAGVALLLACLCLVLLPVQAQAQTPPSFSQVKGATLMKHNGIWYYVKDGAVCYDTTLVKWGGSWYYVKNGTTQPNLTTLVKHNGSWWYVVNGKVASNTTSLVKYNGEWWYVVKGKVASGTTTLIKYNNEWWYVVRGKIASNTTNLIKWGGEWFYVVKGKVAGKTTTLMKYNGGWYYIYKGKLAAKTTTLVKYNGKWYYVENGKVNFSKTTLCQYGGSWYYVKNGTTQPTATTFCGYGGRSYYIKGGVAQTSYTGPITYGGKNYCLLNGAVVDPSVLAVENNGGQVVGYRGNVYYFRMKSDSQEATGVLGSFSVNKNVANDLVCRSADGTEKVIVSTTASDSIYICRNRIIYQKYDNYWYSIGVNGGSETKLTDHTICGYLSDEQLLKVWDYERGYYATDFMGNEVQLPDTTEVLTVHQGKSYCYTKVGDNQFSFYRVNTQGLRESLSSVTYDAVTGEYVAMGDYCVGANGIYFVVGIAGGTGLFFSDGIIYQLSFETGKITPMAAGVNYPTMYLAKDGASEFLFYCTKSYSGVSMYAEAVREGVMCLDLSTGMANEADFPLYDENKPFVDCGELQIYLNNEPQTEVILSLSMLSKMGYDSLGLQGDGSAVYHEWAQLVGNTYYILLTEVVPDSSADMGWRPGYRRISTRLYSIKPGASTPQMISSY